MRSHKPIARSLIAGGLALSVSALANATIIYDENMSGDLSSDWDLPQFTLNVGANEVVGTTAMGDSIRDLDRFGFVLPSGTQLTSVVYSFSDVQRPAEPGVTNIIHNAHISFNIRTNLNQYIGTSEDVYILDGFDVGTSPVSLFSAPILPLGEGTYRWLAGGYGWSGGSTTVDDATWSYRLNLGVEPTASVPAPMTSALMLAGLAGMGYHRRRQRG